MVECANVCIRPDTGHEDMSVLAYVKVVSKAHVEQTIGADMGKIREVMKAEVIEMVQDSFGYALENSYSKTMKNKRPYIYPP